MDAASVKIDPALKLRRKALKDSRPRARPNSKDKVVPISAQLRRGAVGGASHSKGASRERDGRQRLGDGNQSLQQALVPEAGTGEKVAAN